MAEEKIVAYADPTFEKDEAPKACAMGMPSTITRAEFFMGGWAPPRSFLLLPTR
jgi:hypothetical protein